VAQVIAITPDGKFAVVTRYGVDRIRACDVLRRDKGQLGRIAAS